MRKLRWSTLVLPTPLQPSSVNCYLIMNEPLTLIDPGPFWNETWEYLKRQLALYGLRMEDIQRVLLTHAHPDHAGIALRVCEESGADAYLHSLEAEKLELGRIPPYWDEWVSLGGVPADAYREIAKARKRLGAVIRPFSGTALSDGDLLAGDGYTLSAIHTAGHSSGHLCFFEEQAGLMWCGDMLLSHVTPNPITESVENCRATVSQYLDSLRLIAGLPVKKALTGHGRFVLNTAGRCEEIVQHHRQRGEAVLQLLKNHWRSPWEVAIHLHGKLSGIDVFLGVSEAMAHLEMLRLKDRVSCQERNGCMVYHACPMCS